MSNATTPAQSPSIITFTNGSAEHLIRLASPTPRTSFSGAWATVELQPDVFVPQRFTIGIVVQTPGDRLHFKLLDDFKKFECLYHDHFPQKSVRELLAYAAAGLAVIETPPAAAETLYRLADAVVERGPP